MNHPGIRSAIRCGLTKIAMVLILAFPASGFADDPESAAKELGSEQCLKSFDYVWSTIRDKHWDPTLGGLDWNSVRDELRPRAEVAKSTDELNDVLNTMLGRLKQSHFGIISERAYLPVLNEREAGSDDGEGANQGTIGVELRWVDEQAMVWRLDPSSSASEAGVRTGWILSDIDGKSVPDMLRRASQASDGSVEPGLLKQLLVSRLTTGPMGKTRQCIWLDAEDRPIETELTVRRPSGVESKYGNLPITFVDCNASVTEEGIPVFSLNLFFEPKLVLDRFESLLREHRHAPGLVLDLRGNVGGLGFMAMSLGGWLTESTGMHLGTMTTRSGALKFALLPRDEVFAGKVAVLVDEYSMSTSEILAAGLQDNGLARIFGRKSPGMALPSNIEKLPHGAGFQYAFANYHSADGKPLEGFGVVPDESIALLREDALTNRDADIEAAVRWILER